MPQWEYSKIDLNNVPVKMSELDALDDAGKDGWELVGITENNCAYLQAPDRGPRRSCLAACQGTGTPQDLNALTA